MCRVKKLFCWCCLLLLLSACGKTTLSVSAKPPEQPPIATSPSSSSSPVLTHGAGISDPVRLLIPSVGLDAPIENIGILSNGDLATPTQDQWEGVGWYHLGTRPGETGSAVIAGHLDRPGGAPAVFWDLHNVHPGDNVTVFDAQHVALRFRVTQVAAYAPQEAPLQEIFANMGGKYLNLITCAGDWIPTQHQTTLRLVVYTTLLE